MLKSINIKTIVALILAVILIGISLLYVQYNKQKLESQKQELEDQRISKYCVAVVLRSENKLSLDRCKELVKAAGSIEDLIKIQKNLN